VNYFQAVSQVHRSVFQNFVVMNLKFDGADGGTTITDEKGHTFTANGNAQIDDAQSKFGGSSLLLDGAGDYVSAADSVDWTLGTNNFDVGFFFRVPAAALGVRGVMGGQSNSAGTSDFSIFIEKTAADKLSARAFFSGSSVTLTGATTLSADTWYRGRFKRTGSSFQLFLEAVEDANASSANAIVDSTTIWAIGRAGALDSLYHNGWIDDFVFINGAADPCNDVPTMPFPKF